MTKKEFISDQNHKIGLLYLGYRGGGAGITEKISWEISAFDFEQTTVLSNKNEILSNYKKIPSQTVVEIDVPCSLFKIINPLSFIKCIRKVKKCFLSKKIKNVLIPMHHPYSVLMIPILRLIGIRVISAIHDFVPHQGDKKFLIEIANLIIILFSSSVLFFSKNQLQKAMTRYPSLGSKFTNLRLASDFRRSPDFSKPKLPSYDYIFFGRLEPYKGIARLKEAWRFVLEQDSDATLLIRGNGAESEELNELKKMAGVDCRIGYVGNNEVEKLMREVKVILAAHDTATQSGITGLAATFGMLAVTTPCAGFVEQAEFNPRILVAKDFQPSSFACSMVAAKKCWSWSLHKDNLEITTGFTDKFLKKYV